MYFSKRHFWHIFFCNSIFSFTIFSSDSSSSEVSTYVEFVQSNTIKPPKRELILGGPNAAQQFLQPGEQQPQAYPEGSEQNRTNDAFYRNDTSNGGGYQTHVGNTSVSVGTDVGSLVRFVKDVAHFGNKYLKPQYAHILGMDLSFGRRGFADIGGFHHDPIQAFERNNIIKFANKAVHANGCYSADLTYMGEIVKPYATFFPSDWSRITVIEKIYEAYENFVKSGAPLIERGGKYVVEGTTNEGIKIRMHIKKNGAIVTAFPVLK